MQSDSPGLSASLSFLATGCAAAVGVGMLAATISSAGWAPVAIFSLCVGIAVGAAASALARWFEVACPKRLAVATLTMAFVAVVAQHAWLYREYRQQWQAVREREPALALFRPETAPLSPGEYFASEASAARVALWAVDAALVAAGAVGVLVFWHYRLPSFRRSRRRQTCLTPDP